MRQCYFPLLILFLPIITAKSGKTPIKSRGSQTFGNWIYHRLPDENITEWKEFFANQSRLIDHLFKDYNKNVPAVYTKDRYGGVSRSLRCNITLFYIKLLSIDEPKQCALMIIDIIYSYIDPRLTWEPAEFDGIKEIPLTKKDTIWIPDVLPYDIMSYSDSIPEERQIVNIYYNGTVSYYSTAVVEFICHLRLANFPFDDQRCMFRLTSFNLPTTELNVTGSISPDLNIESVGNGEWGFRGVSVENDWYEGPQGLPYSMVIFDMHFRRSTTYYFMLIIAPSFILTVLCLSGLFWTPIERDSYMDNLNLGLTAILAMMLILQMTTENIPKIDEVNKLCRSDPSIPPQVLEVNITLVYSNLLLIDEPGETIHLIIDTYLEWMDYRLKWNPREFDNISTILTGRKKVWVPDVFPYDTAEFDWGVGPEIQQVVIYSTGKVALLSSAIIGYNCELDITNFPFDDQVCAAKYSCYYSNNQEMILRAFYDPGYDVSIMSSNAWTVVRSDIAIRTFHDYAHNWNYSEVNYLFTIRRSDTYYVVLIIIPSYVLSFLCTVGLLWSKITANNYMEKLSLGFAGILAMVLILQMTTQEMPKTWQLPILCEFRTRKFSAAGGYDFGSSGFSLCVHDTPVA